MGLKPLQFPLLLILLVQCAAELIYHNDMNFRVEAGERTCIFESGKAGQMMEIFYQVVDGQHGDLDISFDVINPIGVKIVTDYKKSQNSIIMDLEVDGDYALCMDNTYSNFNSKLVYLYVTVEDQNTIEPEAEVAIVDNEGKEVYQEETLHWTGIADNGEPYYLEVEQMAQSLYRTLKTVVKARHMLDLYGVTKSRDSYLAFEGTFVVDMWSGFQISFMCVVGLVQVYMIKKLFNSPSQDYLRTRI